MTTDFLTILGGLGLFLLGMTVMTDGLKDLTGKALRGALARFTKDPLTGVITGTVGTAVIQSSSATTIMAVGFVGAGLLTFPQALGIIFGANIGTTITGWLVALLGFKLSLKNIVFPLILIGALMRLFGRRRVSMIGFALAGFGLVFAGIGMLQTGMEGFQDIVTPDSFPPDTILGRLLLVLIGIAITVLTQSSSAGVAAAITAVHVGNISLVQGAAMVIGMNVGTTVTAAIAAVGGNVNARRTALAHVLYNVLTGVGALVLLPFYFLTWETLEPKAMQSDPEIALVAFHTLFNVLGVVVALPLMRSFAALVVRLVPERSTSLTRRLDPTLLRQPNVAIDNVWATLLDLSDAVFSSLSTLLRKSTSDAQALARLDEAEQAVAETRIYLSQIYSATADEESYGFRVSALHVLDHLSRLITRSRKEDRLQSAREDKEMARIAADLARATDFRCTDTTQAIDMNQQLEDLWTQLDQRIQPFRRQTIDETAAGESTPEEALARLDAMRWLRRVCYHAWRITHHLTQHAAKDTAVLPEPVEDVPEEMD